MRKFEWVDKSFLTLDPIQQAFIAGGCTWSVTALGAALVFLTGQIKQRLLDAMLGFAVGDASADDGRPMHDGA